MDKNNDQIWEDLLKGMADKALEDMEDPARKAGKAMGALIKGLMDSGLTVEQATSVINMMRGVI